MKIAEFKHVVVRDVYNDEMQVVGQEVLRACNTREAAEQNLQPWERYEELED